MTHKETTSGKKLAKIAHRLHKRETARFLQQALRPKPRWLPWFVWGWIMGIVFKVEEKVMKE